MKTGLLGWWLVVLVLAGMLIPVAGCSNKDNTAPAAAKAGQARYHCPMHPQIVSDKPGECPICGMDLVPIGETGEQDAKGGVPGLSPVIISPESRQRMGLTVGVVGKQEMTRTLRLPARVVPDETRQVRVTTKIEGYVETLYVSVTGQAVKKGDPLLTIYSPALIAAQEEYQVALKSGMPALVEAARQRLLSWDLTDAQIRSLETSNRVDRVLTLYAQAGGLVTEKTVLAGQKIMPGESLMVVTDCSSLWGDADVAESELPLVRVGLPVKLEFPFWPEKTFTGEVSFLPPGLDPDTHTLKARLTVPNPDGLLKLGMYADAVLRIPLGEKTVVPEAAVMQTGTHTYVFRDEGEGKLMPVEIHVGLRNDGVFEVLSGVGVGDHVVTSANFLVDSESAIRAVVDGHQGGARP